MSTVDADIEVARIILHGRFWDSQLYAGNLYLFGLSGDLSWLSWDELVRGLPLPDVLRTVAELALLGNHRLYEPGARLLLHDPEIRRLLLKRFHDLSAKSPWEHGELVANSEDNPLPFPHNDSEVHYQTLYVGASEGVFGLEMGSNGRKQRLSEVPTFNIAAKFQTIAHAAGGEGLYAVETLERSRLSHSRPISHPIHVSKLPCMTCEWAASSVVAAGFDNSIYVVRYEAVDRSVQSVRAPRRVKRQFGEITLESGIFSDDSRRGFSWGAGDKIFRLAADRVEVVEYAVQRRQAKFAAKGEIPVEDTNVANSIVSARSAAFGTVIERDNDLFVILSTGQSFSIPGEPTNWRVFPRSKNYLNHLHIIYNDRLEVWAFTHDYFIDQETKLAGLSAGSVE